MIKRGTKTGYSAFEAAYQEVPFFFFLESDSSNNSHLCVILGNIVLVFVKQSVAAEQEQDKVIPVFFS